MASAKLHKPTNEEHKFSLKISEMTAWGSRVFGHKQQEQQAAAKHCTTCQCSASKDAKPTCVDPHKKEHVDTLSNKDTKSGAWLETKKKDNSEQANIVHKDSKHTTCMELKKKEKMQTANVQTKNAKLPAGAESKKKEKKDHHAKISTTNASTPLVKKEHNNEAANHCFSTMADHWKDRIMMMKKGKDEKYKYSSSSSDSEDDSCVIKKEDKKHVQETKTISNQPGKR